MISNEAKNQAYDRLRKMTSDRVVRGLGIADQDVAHVSLGALINMLFLMHGDGGSTGNFIVSFSAAVELVGMDLMWLEPEAKPTAVEPGQRVN
jgi:hypothetical protein